MIGELSSAMNSLLNRYGSDDDFMGSEGSLGSLGSLGAGGSKGSTSDSSEANAIFSKMKKDILENGWKSAEVKDIQSKIRSGDK